jgi:ribulose-phosphate 3-epimerase
MLKIFPSLLSADFSRLGQEIALASQAGADGFHFDIMDGHFVPNLALSAMVLKAVRSQSRLFYDSHLMVTDPLNFIKDFSAAGAQLIYIHPEAASPVKETLDLIKSLGVKAGLAINPETFASVLEPYLPYINAVLVMTVHPGFAAQSFIVEILPKIEAVRRMIDASGLDIDLAVDGGINETTAPLAVKAGANLLIAGNAIFKSPDYRAAIEKLRNSG